MTVKNYKGFHLDASLIHKKTKKVKYPCSQYTVTEIATNEIVAEGTGPFSVREAMGEAKLSVEWYLKDKEAHQ